MKSIRLNLIALIFSLSLFGQVSEEEIIHSDFIEKGSHKAKCDYTITLPDTLRDKKLMAGILQISGMDKFSNDTAGFYINIKAGYLIIPTQAYFDDKVFEICNYKNYKLSEIEIVPDTIIKNCPFESVCVMTKFKFKKKE